MLRHSYYPDYAIKAEDKLRTRAQRQGANDQERAISLWKAGFLYNRRALYDLDRNDATEYLSDLQRELTKLINGPYSAILDNKLIFEQVFSPIVKLPETLAYSAGSRWYGEIPTNGTLFAKPVSGGGGGGVYRVEASNGYYRILGDDYDAQGLKHFLMSTDRSYYFTKAVEQHPVLDSFYPNTVNTLRILMMRDDAGVFPVTGVLRVGSTISGSVDNFSNGGYSFPLDLSTGVIGEGRSSSGSRVRVHPDSGTVISGEAIPHWERAVSTVEAAMEYCPGIRYAGWDVIIGPHSPVVLEANNYSDVNLLQVHQPLLTTPRARGFYDFFGILDVHPQNPLFD